ncbi:hypothetical protein HK405_001839, partial [Cladochytrium tenue]
MSELAVSDGLIKKPSGVSFEELEAIRGKSPTAKHFVALAVDGKDYHWIRIEEGAHL